MEKKTQTTGKEGELRVIGELLKRGFDVYQPLVDIYGIDCIIRTENGYKEIQIKTRENITTKLLFDVREYVPKDNLFVICYYIKEPDTFWVIPSKVFAENAYAIKKYRKLRLILGDEDSKMRQKLQHFRNNFFQLRQESETGEDYDETKTKKKVKRKESKRLSHEQNWDKRLEWVNEDTRTITRMVMARIFGLDQVHHEISGKYYQVYKGKRSMNSLFAVLMLNKKELKVRVRADPQTFSDSKKWTGDKIYKGWFFKQGQEREFKVTDKEQINYAMELVKQSYALAK